MMMNENVSNMIENLLELEKSLSIHVKIVYTADHIIRKDDEIDGTFIYFFFKAMMALLMMLILKFRVKLKHYSGRKGFHLLFQNFALLCHGLLAGVAAGQCIFVFTLSTTDRTLLEHYHGLALPFQSIYYALLAVCCVSILDRYANISNGWHHFFLTLLSRPSKALAIAAYLFSLVLSVSLAQLDDRISLYSQLPDLWLNIGERLVTWKVVNLLRMIGAVVGWVVVGLNPLDDQTKEGIQYSIGKESENHNVTLKSLV